MFIHARQYREQRTALTITLEVQHGRRYIEVKTQVCHTLSDPLMTAGRRRIRGPWVINGFWVAWVGHWDGNRVFNTSEVKLSLVEHCLPRNRKKGYAWAMADAILERLKKEIMKRTAGTRGRGGFDPETGRLHWDHIIKT